MYMHHAERTKVNGLTLWTVVRTNLTTRQQETLLGRQYVAKAQAVEACVRLNARDGGISAALVGKVAHKDAAPDAPVQTFGMTRLGRERYKPNRRNNTRELPNRGDVWGW